MASDDAIKELRGKQVPVFGLSFHFPLGLPKTDAEIIEREETIGAITEEIADPAAKVRQARGLIKALQADITAAIRKRKRTKATGIEEPELFEEKPEKLSPKRNGRPVLPRKRKAPEKKKGGRRG